MTTSKKTSNGNGPRECFAIIESSKDEHGYIPVLVTENDPGYAPMTGRGECSAPWYWGKTIERAQEVCDRQNKQRYGISRQTAARIIASSMNAQNTTDAACPRSLSHVAGVPCLFCEYCA